MPSIILHTIKKGKGYEKELMYERREIEMLTRMHNQTRTGTQDTFLQIVVEYIHNISKSTKIIETTLFFNIVIV